MLMVGMAHTHTRSVLEGVADYADHHGRWQHQLEVELSPDPILTGGFDGMIVEAHYDLTLPALRKSKIPAITVTHLPDPDGPPAVVVDNRAVGRMAAEYLSNLGLKQLAFVGARNAIYSVHRGEGFHAGCDARRLPCIDFDVNNFGGPETPDDEALAEFIRTLPDPIGILAVNDRRALSVSRACRQVGRRIPESVALLGVDNEAETCRLCDPPLSSIDHGTRRIGYEAARLLDQWMTTGERPTNSVLIQPVGVVSRPSTDLMAIDDPDVVTALRFIRSHATEALKVSDVLQHVAISRRSLEMHFQKTIGRTIHAEITRVRIDRAKHLLISSDWSMPQIAQACGFAFPSQFSHAFSREAGLPPLKFRHQYRYRRSGS